VKALLETSTFFALFRSSLRSCASLLNFERLGWLGWIITLFFSVPNGGCFFFHNALHTSENRKNVSGRKERIVFKTASVIMSRSQV